MAEHGRARPLARWALGAMMVVPPLLFNGAFGWAVVATAVLSIVALGLALATSSREASGTTLGLAIVAAAALTALQAAPLPIAWTRAMAPDAAEAAERAAELLDEAPPALAPISLDPGGTRERTLAALAVAAAFLTGSLHAGRDPGRVVRDAALALAAVLVVTLGHALAGADHVYGIHPIRYAARLVVSPLVNSNHLGGFCAFGAILALGRAAEEERAPARLGYAALALGGAAAVFATLSRGAMGSLSVGAIGFATILALRTRGRRARRTMRALAAFALASAMLATAAHVGFDAIAGELASDDYAKLDVQRRALGIVAESHPLLGVGRGAFGAAVAPALDPSLRFLHPESLPVQWATEWGLPFATLLLATVVVALLTVATRTSSPTKLGGVCAIAAIGLQNLVDFGLEMVGEAVVVAAVAGAVVRPRRAAGKAHPTASAAAAHPARVSDRRLAGLTLGAGLLALAVFGPTVARGGALELELRASEAIARGDHATARALVRDAMKLHPLDPVFPLLGGAAAVSAGDASAPRLLNRAMELAPLWSAPHEVAASLLASRGRVAQAMIELREAEERVAGSAVPEACALLRAHPRTELAEAARPRDPVEGRRFTNALVRCLPFDSELAAALDGSLLREAPELLEPALREARRALRARAPERALAVLEPVAARHRVEPRFAVALSDAYSAAGRMDDAIALLERAVAERDARREARAAEDESGRTILESLALAHARAGHPDDVARVVERMVAGSPSRLALARAAVVEGRAEELLDRPHAALRAYRRADGYDPGCGALERAARLARRQGFFAQAHQLESTLCLRHGPTSPACSRRAAAGHQPRLP